MLCAGGVLAAALLLGGPAAGAGSASAAASLTPFSSLYSPSEDEQQHELERAIEVLDPVASARVVISRGRRTRVLVTVRWAGLPVRVDETIDFIRRLVLHMVEGVQLSDIVIADSSGRLWEYGGQRLAGRARGGRLGLVVAVGALVVMVLAGVLGVWAVMGRGSGTGQASELSSAVLAGRSLKQVARLLRGASPAVKGVVLSAMDESLRRRLMRMVGSEVQMPERRADPRVVETVLSALEEEQEPKPADRGER